MLSASKPRSAFKIKWLGNNKKKMNRLRQREKSSSKKMQMRKDKWLNSIKVNARSNRISMKLRNRSKKIPGNRCNRNMMKIGDLMNRGMKLKGNKSSIRLTITKARQSRNRTERDSSLRLWSMDWRHKMRKPWQTKKICRKKSCQQLISFKQFKSSAMRPNSNHWTYLRLSRKVKKRLILSKLTLLT